MSQYTLVKEHKEIGKLPLEYIYGFDVGLGEYFLTIADPNAEDYFPIVGTLANVYGSRFNMLDAFEALGITYDVPTIHRELIQMDLPL
jgi:hypothetical protein